jgi:hypothetical protein
MHLTFLFVTHNGTQHEELWLEYMRGCPVPTSQHVFRHGLQLDVQPLRFSPHMVEVMADMMVHGLASGATWMHFVSDTCVPVRPCSDFVQVLRASKQTSFIGYDSTWLTKSTQWVTINSAQIEPLLPDFFNFVQSYNCTHGYTGDCPCSTVTCHYPGSAEHYKSSRYTVGAPDEFAFANFWDTRGIPRAPITFTYVSWINRSEEDERRGHPRAFLPRHWAAGIRIARQEENAYFARKFVSVNSNERELAAAREVALNAIRGGVHT